ncbi:hypothetical protein GOODEAATRI_002147 [Goodea atripinnis]|uniref:Uncharacterized protein n=1 Tax=Goodea atripinnis TaxID=208336 RepID=A0ABV0MY01_9TELE
MAVMTMSCGQELNLEMGLFCQGMSRRCNRGVMDPMFRRPNNSLPPDKALFLGPVVVAVQSLSNTTGCWFLPYCHPCMADATIVAFFFFSVLLLAVISGFSLSPLNNYFFSSVFACVSFFPTALPISSGHVPDLHLSSEAVYVTQDIRSLGRH